MQDLLICTDLDRTLLPNGPHPESVEARPMFARFVAHPEVLLAYVSGRDPARIEASIQGYSLPSPQWIVADVGSTIFRRAGGRWEPLEAWSQWIAEDWQGRPASDLVPLFQDLAELTLQPPDRQSRHKLSYVFPLTADQESLPARMEALLDQQQVRASLVISADEPTGVGLLDVLPPRSGKRQALAFLLQSCGLTEEQTLFAGDSGNDLSVLVSSLPAVLVANAHPSVRQRARSEASASGTSAHLYLAEGDFLGMNGNYSAGILEGIAHFHPDALRWMH